MDIYKVLLLADKGEYCSELNKLDQQLRRFTFIMRYSKEYKLECIRKYKNGEHIQDPGGCKHKTFHDKVRHWVRIYDKLGEVGLEHKKPKLTVDDKIEICNRVSNGEAINEVAISYGRQEANIAKIYKNYLQHGIDGLKSSKKKGRPPTMKEKETDIKNLSDKEKIKTLEEQIELQQIEIEYLKKLSALVQARKDREQQKK